MDVEVDEAAMFMILDLSHQNSCMTHPINQNWHSNISDLCKIWGFHNVGVEDSGHMGNRVINWY
jgi:hypothetical protein